MNVKARERRRRLRVEQLIRRGRRIKEGMRQKEVQGEISKES